MKPIPWRVQLGAVAAGYAMVFLVGAALVFERHIQYVNNPADAASYGAMYAFGDLILGLFIGGLFLVPTLLACPGHPQIGDGVHEIFTDRSGLQPDRANLPGNFPHPRRKRGELVPGLVLYGSSVGFSDHYCRAGSQPVAGAICPCQATDLVCVAGRAGNNRLAVNTLLFFSGGPPRVMRQSRQSWIDATGCSVFAGI